MKFHFLKAILFIFLTPLLGHAQTASEKLLYNSLAQKIVKSNLSYIKRNYYGYSGGFSSEDEFNNQRMSYPITDYINILDSYREYRINVPSRHRMQILAQGYLNQHQTGISSGCLCPDNRNSKEAAMINWSKSDYVALNNYVKPKYGSMGIIGQSLKGAVSYGDDIFILDENKIQGRVTYTLADSLGISGTYFNGQNPIFVPTDFPELLLGLLKGNSPDKAGKTIYNNGYTEIQIWGVLRMEDLKEFRYSVTPPSETLTKFFVDNNIRIRQIMCSDSKIGDESCLKDYVLPSVIQIQTLLDKKEMAKAEEKFKELVVTGTSLNTLYNGLKNKYKDWMLSQIKLQKDLGEQDITKWMDLSKTLEAENKISKKEMIKLYTLYGDQKAFIEYALKNKLDENTLSISSLGGLVYNSLDLEVIKSIKLNYPLLTKKLKQDVENLIDNPNISSEILISFTENNSSKLYEELTKRINDGNDPYKLMSYMDSSQKINFLDSVKKCLKNVSVCVSPGQTSFGLLSLNYGENLLINSQTLWDQYFNQQISAETFGKQGSLIDLIQEARTNKADLNIFYTDLDNAIKRHKYYVSFAPYELAIELEKDGKDIDSLVKDNLAATLIKTPHQSIYFSEKKMSAPVVPTYYHLEQVSKGSLKLPSLYPVEIFIKRIIERSNIDPNTQLYRLFISNLPKFFIGNKEYKDDIDSIYAAITPMVPLYYQFSLMQGKAYLDYKVNDIKDVLKEVKTKLYDWQNLSQADKDIFIKSLDVIPLYILEEANDKNLVKDYLAEVQAYLDSSEFASFSKTNEYKEWEHDRSVFSKGYYYRKNVSNKISDFMDKFEEMTK